MRVYILVLCSSFLQNFPSIVRAVSLTTLLQIINIKKTSSITMHSSVFVLSLSLALAGVHSSPVPSLSTEVDTLRAARALPSGDLYPPQPPGAGPGKRGLIYNSETKVEWSEFYVGSPYVTYGSNGDVVRGDQIDARFSYVPTLAVDSNLQNSEWNGLVPILIEGGTKALFA